MGNKINNDKINLRCAGITDCDPLKTSKPTKTHQCYCKNYILYLEKELSQHSENCRLFKNLKTFEYDLAIEGNNLAHMCKVELQITNSRGKNWKVLKEYSERDWNQKTENEKANAAYWLLQRIDKGVFAQQLALVLHKKQIKLEVPTYIKDAVLWVCKFA